ncbi:hypothetical protein [Marinicella meishanensis]|uniref:hypothetical protein n=1 Tax=Marinicella meishanensis TaxID=2873263 RepID=UPI001CBFBCAC|nr:hypothetical protein [Marinicella sp. NBU2979]
MTLTKSLMMVLMGLGACNTAHAEWQLLYEHDRQGQQLKGSKNALFQAIRDGQKLRVVWRASRSNDPTAFVEHVIEPAFVTNASDQEVFVQTPEHIGQTSYWDTELQDFNAPAVVWRGLLSTTGRFMAVWYDRGSGQVVRRMPQRVPIKWFAEFD